MRRGIAFWEEALRVSPGREALRGFGWWTEVLTIDADQWERLTLDTCEQAEGDLDWAGHVAKRASSRPSWTSALRILTLLVQAQLEHWESYRVSEHALKALEESPKIPSLSEVRDELRTTLLERGHFRANDFQWSHGVLCRM